MSAPWALAELQSWLFDRVTQPAVSSAPESRDPDELVVSGRLPAGARVEVYRHGYVARLVECLEDDYPALQHALGHGQFERLCRDFIAEHPPPSSSLNYYGAPLARFCALRSEPWSAFGSELAQLEWAIVEAIHAEEGDRLDIAALARLSPDEWSRARLVPSPALRLLTSTYPVADYYQAFQDGVAPAEQWPAPAPSAVAVCRRAVDVWRIRLSSGPARVLASLMGGTALLEALERVSGGLDSDGTQATPEELQRAFQDWVSCGLFSSVALAGSV